MKLLLRYALALVAALVMTFSVSAQEAAHWSTLLDDPNANFYDVQKSFNDFWADKEITRGQGYKQFKRWEWFTEPRVYPSGERINPMQAYNEIMKLRGTSASIMNPSGVWTYYGNTSVPTNGGGAGRINAVRNQPGSTTIYYACAPAGGLWKSTNSGGTWTLMNTDLLPSLGVTDVAIDPNNVNTLYIATGDGDAADTYSVGVMKSTDGGNTWNTTGLNWNVTQSRRISRLLMHPTNSNILIAATSAGIYKTTDGGTTWSNNQGGNFKDLEFKPGDPNTMYATGNGVEFWRSTNNGDSWTLITAGLPTSGVNRMALGVSPANSAYVYVLAGSSANSGFYGLYRSTDSGQTFTTRSTSPNILGWDVNGGGTGGQSWYDLACTVDPGNANEVYVGGVNVWKSTNGGTNWTCVGHWYGAGGTPYVHADIHGMDFIPGTNTLLVGCDGGVFRTTNGGASFADLSSNLQVAQIYRLGLAATNAARLFTGWQDNGSNLKNGSSWSRPLGGDGMECIISHSDQNTMYGTIYYGQIYKSTDGGNNFSTIVGSGGTGVDEDGAWVTPYAMDPNNSNTLWVGKSRVYKSTNGGTSWTSLGAIAGGNINALAVAPSNTNYIYASKGATLYRSTDGNNFSALSGLPNLSITYIAVDPTNPSRVWVTLSGYSNNQKVYFSSNAGSTWTNFSTGLPNIPANTIVYQSGTNDGLYVGTDAGVYYRDGNFPTWQPFMDGLPLVPVSELEIHYGSGYVVAATYGRGVWRAPLFATPDLDAAVVSVVSPTGTQCETSITPEIQLSNFGNTTITSLTINYGVSGVISANYNWTGSITTGALLNITLPGIDPGTGSHSFFATITNVNGQGADENVTNDNKTSDYVATGGTLFIDLNLLTDCYANETSYSLSDDQGNVLFAGGGYSNSTNYLETWCLNPGCYEFTIYDSYGDGIAGSLYGCNDGDYTITDENGFVLVEMSAANFGFSATHSFCIPLATTPGCTDPLADNYDPAANVDDGSCVYSCAPVTVTIATDCWGGEVSWSLVDDFGTTLYSVASGTLASQTIFNTPFCLPEGCYTFQINDTYGDGLAGIASGCPIDGYYEITDGDGNILVSMPVVNYGTGTSHVFCVTVDNGILGCTDPAACNYDPAANTDDGSCTYPQWYLPNTLNAGPAVLSCTAPANYYLADQACVQTVVDNDPFCLDTNWDSICQSAYNCCLGVNDGCTDINACNYDPVACNDPALCIYPGCTDPTACNYDAAAGCDNGSCLPAGCMDNTACNYNPSVTCDDGSCVYPGCTIAGACNYDPAAGCDDGSCTFPQAWYADNDNDGFGDSGNFITSCTQFPGFVAIGGDCNNNNPNVYPGAPGTGEGIDNNCNGTIDPDEELPCVGDFNDDGIVNVGDLLMMLSEVGCSAGCMTDMNNDGTVNTGDMVMFLALYGNNCP